MIGLYCLAAAILLPVAALAQDQRQLYGACFAGTYEDKASRPSRRIGSIAVAFQGFEGSLLASVTYRLRYGTRFGFSGDCTPEEAGGAFVCKACGSGGCAGASQTFRIRWPGADTLELINDTTGLFAENPAGGRDRLAPGGPHAIFALTRAPADACTP